MIEQQLQVIQTIQEQAKQKTINQGVKIQQEQQKYEEQIYENQEIEGGCPVINIIEVGSQKSVGGQEQNRERESFCKDSGENMEGEENEEVVKEIENIEQKQVNCTKQTQKQNNQFNPLTQQEKQQSNHGFTINVCHVQSEQNLPQNLEYTQDTHIQPHPSFLIEDAKRTQQIQSKKAHENENKPSIYAQEKPQYDDYYVQLLEQKWAKRELEKNNKLDSKKQGQNIDTQKVEQKESVQNNKKQNQQKDNSMQKLQLKKITSSSSSNKGSPLFKITKKKDDIMNRSTQKFRSKIQIKSQNNTLDIKKGHVLQNKSQIIHPLTKKLSQNPIKQTKDELKIYKRSPKKHLSNFENYNERSLSKSQSKKIGSTTKPTTRQIDISYEIQVGNQVEMMSKILQDKYYNSKVNNMKKDEKQSQSKERYSQTTALKRNASQGNKVRKIIKRSPYGLLEIEVKQKKNNSKITNLRILKPKEMIKLKKVSRIGKFNKQNEIQDQSRETAFLQGNKLDFTQKAISKNVKEQLPRIS